MGAPNRVGAVSDAAGPAHIMTMSTQASRHPSRFLRAVRGASPALWPARLRLLSLKAAYKSGAYSGHPETMLDAMDG